MFDPPDTEGEARNPLLRLIRTTSFRFTFYTVIVFLLAVAGFSFYLYDSTIGQALRQASTDVETEAANLEQGYYFIRDKLYNETYEGMSEAEKADPTTQELLSTQADAYAYRSLRGTIRLKIRQNTLQQFQSDASDWLYTLINPKTKLRETQGSLQVVPEEYLSDPSLKEFTYKLTLRDPVKPDDQTAFKIQDRHAIGTLVRIRSRETGELQAIFFVGKDIDELVKLRTSARDGFVLIFAATLILGLIMGYWSSRSFLARVDNVNRTAAAIRQGDLSKRIPYNADGDEFDMLAQNLNAMLDQIERLMNGMRQVSDNIAHDLRSPLTRIRNRIENTLKDPAADPRQTLAETAEDSDRMIATFNALLSITRIESGERVRNMKPVNLAAVATEIAELYEPAAQDAGFELILQVEKVPPVMGVQELLSQALVNLLDNAIKYACLEQGGAAKPRIEVKVAPKPGGGTLVSVMDNGPGVPVHDREKIASRFVRLETSRSTSGSGLGLSMVAAIVRAHSGQLSFGPGLARDEDHAPIDEPSAFGLGIRIAFPAAKVPDSVPFSA